MLGQMQLQRRLAPEKEKRWNSQLQGRRQLLQTTTGFPALCATARRISRLLSGTLTLLLAPFIHRADFTYARDIRHPHPS
jgi:hypothetical protein